MSSNCPIFRIPDLCAGALLRSSSTQQGDPLYVATYPIAGLSTELRGYDPSNNVFSGYHFTPADVMKVSTPTVYFMDNGSGTIIHNGGVTSEGVVDTNVACVDNYNTQSDNYYVVSWWEPSMSVAGSL